MIFELRQGKSHWRIIFAKYAWLYVCLRLLKPFLIV